MAKNFASIAFTDAVKALQEKHNSRNSYERKEKFNVVDGLSNHEMGFITNRDSFYLATIGANNFPYIQHRGGPKGFLKILDKHRVGFLDFTGNKQYISVGNIATNANVAIIMVDYSAQERLKIYAKAKIVELKDDPKLLEILDLENYKFRAERMMIFYIEAYDWNCPQHITPRFTAKEVENVFEFQQTYIAQLEEENKTLTNKLKEKEY